MFKGKVHIYKNINGHEVKVEKKFDNESDFNDYINKNPDLKKMENDFAEDNMPKSFIKMRSFLDDFNDDLFENSQLLEELDNDFEKILEKSKYLLGK